MKISQFIKRLRELQTIAGDVEVTVTLDETCYDEAAAELTNVVPVDNSPDGCYWERLDEGNTEQIVTVY